MTEDMVTFTARKEPHWQLSGQDIEIVTRLHAQVWQWLLAANSPKDIRAMGYILEALEELIKTGAAPEAGECEINLKTPGEDGVGAHFSTSPAAVMFGLTEYVWMGAQGFDHGSILDEEGRPFHLEFTPNGSFDAAAFEFWMHYAEQAAPTSIADPACVYGTWYGKGAA